MLYISREQHKQILTLGVLFEICSWPMGQNSELFLSPRVSNTHTLSLSHTHTILVIVWTHTHIIGVVLIIIFFKMSFFPGELKSKMTSCLPFKSNSTKNVIYVYTYMFLLFSHPVRSDSLRPHGLQYPRPPCTYVFVYIYIYICNIIH